MHVTTAIYLLLGVGLMGGLFYALTQITARQRRLTAELTRLERLAAEVSMNAEAVLERVDERMEQLTAMLAQVSSAVEAAQAAAAQPPAPAPAPAVAAEPKKRKRAPKVEAQPPAPEANEPTSIQRYQQVRSAVWAMADEGKELGEIAQALSIPRGEAELMLNLRGRKVRA